MRENNSVFLFNKRSAVPPLPRMPLLLSHDAIGGEGRGEGERGPFTLCASGLHECNLIARHMKKPGFFRYQNQR